MATKRISATTRKEVRDFAVDAVPRRLGADITISSPDFKGACQKAQAALTDARKRWEDGGKPKRGRLYDDMIIAAVTAEVICAFV